MGDPFWQNKRPGSLTVIPSREVSQLRRWRHGYEKRYETSVSQLESHEEDRTKAVVESRETNARQSEVSLGA